MIASNGSVIGVARESAALEMMAKDTLMEFHRKQQLSEQQYSPHCRLQQQQQQQLPVSRTHQYKKVMKPMLERKRRARINKCLDELKDLMVDTLQINGESIAKVEKAEVLELTVKHLQKLKSQDSLLSSSHSQHHQDKFKVGFLHCAQETSKFVSDPSVPIDVQTSTTLLSHLTCCIKSLECREKQTFFQIQQQQQQHQHHEGLEQKHKPLAESRSCNNLIQSPSPQSPKRSLVGSLKSYRRMSSNRETAWRPW